MTLQNLDDFFQTLAGKFQPGGLADLHAKIQFHLSGEGGGNWCMTIQDGRCTVQRGVAESPDASLDTSAEEFVSLMTDSAEEIGWAFMQGRFNMTGNIAPLWRTLAFLRELRANAQST
ncbi:MAG: SCP2 sterol-binding domain-containing protein [Acidobacteriaceae bacterium]